MSFEEVRAADRRLVSRLSSGDEDAWEELWIRYGPLVQAIAKRAGCDADEAGDVLQQVALIALENLERLRDHAKLGGWLAGIARRQALAHRRRRKPWSLLYEDTAVSENDLDEKMIQDQRLGRLWQSFATLDSRCQRLLQALELREPPATYLEIATAEGLKESSIGPIRRRCLEKLRKKFNAKVSGSTASGHKLDGE